MLRRQRQGIGLVLLVALLATAAPRVWSQPQPGPGMPVPRLLLLSQHGAKAGDSVEITLTGTDVEEPTGLMLGKSEVKVEWTDKGSPAEMKKGQPKNVAVAVKGRFTIPPGTPLGIRDLRVINRFGVSSPRAFVVSDLPEVTEKEPNNDVDQAQRVELNSAVSGVISTPTDVDYYIFKGKKDQRVVVSCLTSSIDSRLQPSLQLYKRDGSPLAFNRDYRGTDAVLDAVLPADGDYYVRVFSFTYTLGGSDYFYRLAISTTPWIDAVHPCVIEPGKETKVTVYGRNLPGGKIDPTALVDGRPLEKVVVTVKPPADPRAAHRLDFSEHVSPTLATVDGFELRIKNAAGSSNAFLLTYALAPVVLDNEANDTPATAQVVTLPCEIAGRIEKVRDRDFYRFRAARGDVWSIEAYGDRIGSPLDLYFTVKQVDGKGAAAEFDDNPELLHPTQFYNRTDDPARYRFVAPADGEYLLQVSSREADIQAGPRHLYRVRITQEKPDFRLIVMPPTTYSPDEVVLRPGSSHYWTALAARQDGFNGEIAIKVEGLPAGVTCKTQTVGAGQKQSVLVLTAALDAKEWNGLFTVKGTANIDGKVIEREARPATITWAVPAQQQNVPTVARLCEGLALAVRDTAPFGLALTQETITATVGEKVNVPIKLTRRAGEFNGTVQVTLVGLTGQQQQRPMTFNNNAPLSLSQGKDEATGVLDVRSNALPGTYTLAFQGQAPVPFAKDPMAKNKSNVTVSVSSPALVVKVLPKELAKVSVAPNNPKVQIGKDTELVVKVARLFELEAPFKVELVASPDTRGLSAKEATVPAGKDEVKLNLEAAAGTTTGQHSLTIRATATYEGKTFTHEAKVNVTVSK
jgi:hypothetical protein